MTFETLTGFSMLIIPPSFETFPGLTAFFMMFTPSTTTFPLERNTFNTFPVLPLSFPAITFTLSSFFIFICLPNFLRQRYNLQKSSISNLSRNGTEDTCAYQVSIFVYNHGCVVVEPYVAAVFSSDLFFGSHNNGFYNCMVFYRTCGVGTFYYSGNEIAYPGDSLS